MLIRNSWRTNLFFRKGNQFLVQFEYLGNYGLNFIIINDEYNKHLQYDNLPDDSVVALTRLGRKLGEIRLEIEKRGIDLKR